MPKKTTVLLPETVEILEQMGLQIKYARLRRKLTSELVAKDDELGRKLQDLSLPVRKRAPKGIKK